MDQRSVAIVSGAGRGIGRATAIELGRTGFGLSLLARTEADLTETARQTGGEKCLTLFSLEEFLAEKTLAPEDVARVIASCVRGDLIHSSGEVIYLHREVS